MEKSFKYVFESSKLPEEVFNLLLDIDKWWSGLYAETIEGKSHQLNDEFTFSAGGGVHYSKQKLIELIPNKKIVWSVTDSNLAFLSDTQVWTNTKFGFDIGTTDTKTTIIFTHEGLIPQIECYDSCSSAWTQYFEKLKRQLK